MLVFVCADSVNERQSTRQQTVQHAVCDQGRIETVRVTLGGSSWSHNLDWEAIAKVNRD